jgi:5-methylcytosine-specific restriction protein B
MHTHGNRESMVYWIEYKNDDEFAGTYFGGISGGGAHMYGIFRRSNTEQWVKGNPRNEQNITAAEAIVIARTHRDQLLAGVALLEALPAQASDSEYLALQKALEQQAPELVNKAWAHKYFFLAFPDKLDDFHNERWQRFHLVKLLQEPPADDGLYVVGGRFVRLATDFGWAIDELTSTLNERNGRPIWYWRVGTRIGGTDSIWEEMKTGGYIAVGWSKIGDLSEFTQNGNRKEQRAAIMQLQEKYYPDDPKNVSSRQAGELLNFVAGTSEGGISEGEIVMAGDGEKVLGIGRVTGPYFYDGSTPIKAPHRRPVEWLSFDQWKQPIIDGLRTTVWLLKKNLTFLEIEKRILGATPIILPPPDPVRKVATTKPRLGGIPARVQAILERKGQAILYGPPGTGKTYWARQTAFDLAAIEAYGSLFHDLSPEEKVVVAGDDIKPGLVRCCTFHPAYGYEDFLEGYRPQANAAGQLTFLRRDGIFKSICDDAKKAPVSQKFILLIDEINRGDIPRIFGELLTLLELDKRETSLSLPLSGQTFQVPKNLYVIGTMNTADRSIALLDTALRRRFGFVELMPDSTVFGSALVDGGIPLGPWLNALNERIRAHLGRDSRNLQVGHSYLLHGGKPVTDISRFVRVLADDLIPLLEEYCYEDFNALTRILGPGLVNEERQCIRVELFEPARQEELVQVLLSQSPDIVTSIEAASPEESPEESEEVDVEDES